MQNDKSFNITISIDNSMLLETPCSGIVVSHSLLLFQIKYPKNPELSKENNGNHHVNMKSIKESKSASPNPKIYHRYNHTTQMTDPHKDGQYC